MLDRATITDLEADTSNEAIACNRIYTQVRDQMLRSHPWNFAIKREALAKLTTSPSFEFTNAFQLPNDFVRTVKLFENAHQYKLEGTTLLTDNDTAKLIYVSRVTDTTKFDPSFVEALVLKLAVRLCYTFTGSVTRISQLEQDFKKTVSEAKRVDGQEGTHDAFQPNIFTDVHGSTNIDWSNI